MSRTIFNGLWITEHRKSGKMEDMDSVMLSHPSFCMRTCGVCGSCYSKRMSKYRPRLAKKQIQNSSILSKPDFIPCKLNTINGVLRWISTGELENQEQYLNICRMAHENNHLVHVVWTKRLEFVDRSWTPYNLTVIWSATKIDVTHPGIPEGADAAFYVYSSEDKIPEGMIHCNKKCRDCTACYQLGFTGMVAEVLK